MAPEGTDGRAPEPATLGHRAPLTSRQRRRAVLAGLAPIGLAALVLAPFAVTGPATLGDVIGAALVYGGLLGLAAGFVYVDRVHARQCPRCTQPGGQAGRCPTCGYDLETRPRFACEQRHAVYVEDGLCDCGRRLHRLPDVRGVGREITWMLKVGAWLLAFLLGMGLLLQIVGNAG